MDRDVTINALYHYGTYLGNKIRNEFTFYLSSELDKVIKELLNKGACEKASELTEQYT